MNGLPTTQHDLNPRGIFADDVIDRHNTTRLIQWPCLSPRLRKDLTRGVESHWSSGLVLSDSDNSDSSASTNLLLYYTLLIPAQLQNKTVKVIVPCLGWATSIAPASRFGCDPMGISGQVFQESLYGNRTSECLQIVASRAKSSVGAGERDLQGMVAAL